jgi:hypothetical protein
MHWRNRVALLRTSEGIRGFDEETLVEQRVAGRPGARAEFGRVPDPGLRAEDGTYLEMV